jgi:hypothetical protein
MTPVPLPVANPPRHAWFKAGLFALLAGNTAAYLVSGTTTEAVDAVSWLVLLLLFELETDFGWSSRGRWAASAARGIRLVAAAAVLLAADGYLREQEWLDAINAGLWIAIVIMLESQVRFPAAAARRRTGFTVAASLLYGGLGLLVAAWIGQGEWFDAYDALLWLAALVVIEMNIMRELRRSGHRQAG